MKNLILALLFLLLLGGCADDKPVYDRSTPDRAVQSMFQFFEENDRAFFADTTLDYFNGSDIEFFFDKEILRDIRHEGVKALGNYKFWDFYSEHRGLRIDDVDIQSATRARVIITYPNWFDSHTVKDGELVFDSLKKRTEILYLTTNGEDEWFIYRWYQVCPYCGGTGIADLYAELGGDKSCFLCDGYGKLRFWD